MARTGSLGAQGASAPGQNPSLALPAPLLRPPAPRPPLPLPDAVVRRLLLQAPDVLAWWRAGTLTWVSPALPAHLGWQPEQWQQSPIEAYVHPSGVHHFRSCLQRVDHNRERLLWRSRLRDPEHQYHWVEIHGVPCWDNAGEPDGVIAALRQVDSQVGLELRLQRQSCLDGLTHLLNRRTVLASLGRLTAHQGRQGHELALLFCDLDGFKAVNDRHGHPVGDALLQELARRIRTSLRQDDLAARLGGDEVLVVLPGVRDVTAAAEIATHLCEQVAAPIQVRGLELQLSLSIGVTLACPGEPVERALERADRAMYQAKHAGGNGIACLLAPP